MTIVAGTQAVEASKNVLSVMRVSRIKKTSAGRRRRRRHGGERQRGRRGRQRADADGGERGAPRVREQSSLFAAKTEHGGDVERFRPRDDLGFERAGDQGDDADQGREGKG